MSAPPAYPRRPGRRRLPHDPHRDGVRLARLRVVRALRDVERGRRRYRMAYQRLLRTLWADPEARKAAHRLELVKLRRLEQGLDEAILGMAWAEHTQVRAPEGGA